MSWDFCVLLQNTGMQRKQISIRLGDGKERDSSFMAPPLAKILHLSRMAGSPRVMRHILQPCYAEH